MRFLCIVSLCALIGCEAQSPKPSAAAGANGKTAKLTPVEIQLNWFPEAEHGGYYAALVHGYFAEEGLDVALKPGGPEVPLMESVAIGRVAFGVDNADKLLGARAAEADVLAVFAPIQNSPRCIMVHAESGIAKLADLATVDGVTLAWNSSQPFAMFLSKQYDLSKLTMIKYPGSVGPFLLDKKFAQQAYNISEPFLAKKEGADPVSLMLSDIGFNTYTSVLLTTPELAKEQPDLVRKVVKASQRGWQKYLTDAEETNRKIAELNREMPVDVLTYGVKELQPLCRPNDLPEAEIGKMDAERWQTLVRQLEEIEAIKPNAVRAGAAFSTEFLPK